MAKPVVSLPPPHTPIALSAAFARSSNLLKFKYLLLVGVVMDIRDKVKENPTAELMADDLMAWMDENGPLPDGAVVLVLTGWGSR